MKQYKILHLADIHIPNEPKEHIKFREQFEKLYTEIETIKPNRIAIVGDTLDAFIATSLESEVLCSEFLNKLTELTESVIVTIGNHEIRKKDLKRTSSIGAVIKMIQNPKIKFFDKSGFFEDGDLIWVNYSHLEKTIIPWKDIQHKKDKNKVYIGLFHDPVYGCKLPNGTSMETKNLVKLSDFDNNDLNMFGDIHLRQFFNKTTAYCGSFIQNTHGETIENHGGLIWSIDVNKNIISEELNIDNDYTFITFKTDENFDYDNIKFDNIFATDKSSFRLIWKDYTSNINNENENKIKNYISNKWNNSLTIQKNRIYSNINNSSTLLETIDITNNTIQQDLFKEYLILNKYDDIFIDEILKIDDLITSRLEIAKTLDNVEWNIDRLWCDNFKSYGKMDIDFSNLKNKIFQITGINQQGKSTILDLITYITHGTTLATNKLGGAQREKNGDNRYINNKRTLDYCEGGMIIDVSGDKYTLIRRSERSWNKGKKAINGVSTNIEYYEGIEISEDNKMRGEKKDDTQKMLDAIIGDFEDFVRLTLTNSENLNHLISLDRATFIDSVIRDAGLGIFEKKLEIFKDYKKELSTSKIDINLKDAEEEVIGLKELLKTHKIDHDTTKKDITNIDEQISEINKERDIEIKKLHKIDDDVASIDIETATSKIEEYKTAIQTNLTKQNTNSDKMKSLKKEYDKEKYENLLKLIKTIEDDILNFKLKISQEENKIEKENGNILRVGDKVKQLKTKEIDNQKLKLTIINNDIEKIEDELTDAIEEKKRDINDKKKTEEFEVRTLTTEINNIKEKGVDLKKQIKELEESKVCPTCNREYDSDHQEHINTKVEELNKQIADLMTKGKTAQGKLNTSKKTIETLIEEHENIETSEDIVVIKTSIKSKLNDKQKEIDLINTICDEIKKDDFTNVPDLETNINMGLKLKEKSEKEIEDCNERIVKIKKDIKQFTEDKSGYQSEVYVIEQDKEEVKSYESLVTDNKELSLKIDNIKLTIENAKTKIDKYYEQLTNIKENEIIEENISSLDTKIRTFNSEKTDFNNCLAEIMSEATATKSTIEDIQNNIKKYKEQVKRDELLKEYQKCISRDGVPTFMLLKYRDLINIEMEDLLCNVDFNIFFDENLDLKMYDKSFPNAIQSTLTGSGMERTFSAIVLKIALRNINTKSRPSLLLLDEVMGKLKGETVNKFNSLLEILKTKIDKIIIIEHTHNINYDVLISVEKDKNGISSLSME